ncbi:Protein of unknown function, partial [Gryllus bimaculatus]
YRTYSTDQSRRSRSNVTGVQREHQKSVISLVDIAVNTPRRVFCSPICYRLDLFIREETFLKLLLESLSRKKMGECGVPEAGNWHLRVCSSGSIDDSLRLSGWHSGLFAHPRRCLETAQAPGSLAAIVLHHRLWTSLLRRCPHSHKARIARQFRQQPQYRLHCRLCYNSGRITVKETLIGPESIRKNKLENIDHGIWDRSPNNRPEVRKTLRHKIIYVFP